MGNCCQYTKSSNLYIKRTWSNAEAEMVSLSNTKGLGTFEPMTNRAGPNGFPFRLEGSFCKLILDNRHKKGFKTEMNIKMLNKKIKGDSTYVLLPTRILQTDHCTAFVYPLCDCDLVDWVRRRDVWTANERDAILHQIMAAVNFLHQLDLVHRDIKLENICLRNGVPVLVDIDNCTMASTTSCKGTRDYMPSKHTLEQIYLKRPDIEPSTKNKWVDTYALGKTIANILCVEDAKRTSNSMHVHRVWDMWCRKQQSSLRVVGVNDVRLYTICRWWKVVLMFCKYNDEAVFDSGMVIKSVKNGIDIVKLREFLLS